MSEFKDRLKAERIRLGLSQDALAKLVDKEKGQSFISNFETGGRSATSWIVELAHALGVDAYWLKTGKGEREKESRALSSDEETILAGFALMEPGARKDWLGSAQRRIDERAEAARSSPPDNNHANAA